MSIRVDSSSLITGAVVVGVPGLGVLAESVPSTGEHGAGYLFPSLEFPADAGKEVRGLITTWPTLGTLTAFEDSSFEYDGASDTFAFQMYVDGVVVGTPQTVTLTAGAEIDLVVASATSATTSDSATVSQTHVLLVADALSATTSEVAQAGQGGQHTVTATDATSATVSETASILQTHRILVSDVVSATLSSTASAGAVSGSPTGLEGTPGQHSITWVWEAVSGAAGYEIEYGPVGGPHVRADTGSVTSFEQTGLSGNTPYEARVRSYV